MAISANDFWQQITRIGVVDTATCRAWIDRFQTVLAKRAAAAPGAAAKPIAADAITVAQFLIANHVLTKFQSQRLLAGRGNELRLGEYLVLDRCDQPPMSRWFRGRHLTSHAECFLYPCTDALTSPRWVDPQWLAAHAAVNSDGLQPINIITFATADPWRGAIVSELPAGRSLDRWAADQGPLDHATVASIGKLLSHSLAAMHAAGLVHGEPRPSRIWCGEDASLWLLRDAGRPAAHPADPPQEHRWFDDDSAAELYAAPELADPDSVPSPASDLFAIGALLFELASGRKLRQTGGPFEVPNEIAIAAEAGALGDPLMRTLAFAIAPNPQARFADLVGFSRALEAVAAAYEALPTPPVIVPTAAGEPAPTAAAAAAATVAAPVKSPSSSPSSQPPPPARSRLEVATPPQSPSSTQRSTPEAVATKPASKGTAPPVPAVAVLAAVNKEDERSSSGSPEPAAPPSSAAPQVASSEAPQAASPGPSVPPSPPRTVRRRTRRTRRGPIIIGSIAVVILMGILAVVLQPTAEETRPRRRPPLPPRPSIATTATPPSQGSASAALDSPQGSETNPPIKGGYELVADERLLWAPPWSLESEPPKLEMIPPGSQLVVTLRLNRILNDSADAKWLDWMGPELSPALADFEQQAGLKFSEVERLTIAFSAGSVGNPLATYTVTSGAPLQIDALTKAWKASPSRTPAGKTIYSDGQPQSNAYYLSENPERDRTFVFGPVDLISLVAENDGDVIPLPRSLQQLWDTASSDADLVALTIPNFLFADGRELLRRYAPRAIDPLRTLLIPDVAGAIVSMSFADAWYAETRLSPSGTVSASALLQRFQPRIEALPAWAESFAVDANVDASWRAMAIRLPQFMRAVTDQTRYGVSQTLPTLNLYLPAEAAPQIALGTALALSTAASEPLVAAVQAPPMAPLTAEQMLESTLSVSFDQESLQLAVEMIREEFARSLPPGSAPPTIRIIGGDLEKMGITQNQQIRDFQMRDRPLREALTELVRQANPDKSVTALSDPKQSLVWVVDPSADPKTPTILITTRPAAEANQIDLPKEFVSG